MHVHVPARVALAEDVRALEVREGRGVRQAGQGRARRGDFRGIGQVESGRFAHGADCRHFFLVAPHVAPPFVAPAPTGLDRATPGRYIGNSTRRERPMAEEAVPVSATNAPGWAFLAAAACLALLVAGIVLDERSTAATVSLVLAAAALPSWLAIGLHLATRTGTPSRRARALLILAAIIALLATVAAIAALLFAHHRAAAVAFVAGCVVAGFCLERAS
jgi:hypothetical protein